MKPIVLPLLVLPLLVLPLLVLPLLVLPLLSVLLCEIGCTTVILNAAPHQTLGFWLWFGGLAVLSPIYGYWLYRRLMAAKAESA